MGVEILDFRLCNRNTLRGFAKVKLSQTGLIIDGITLHERNGQKWLSMQARKYEKDDGEEGWARICYFEDRDVWDKFQVATLKAVAAYRPESEGAPDDEEMPL
jgi:hypothetical protein